MGAAVGLVYGTVIVTVDVEVKVDDTVDFAVEFEVTVSIKIDATVEDDVTFEVFVDVTVGVEVTVELEAMVDVKVDVTVDDIAYTKRHQVLHKVCASCSYSLSSLLRRALVPSYTIVVPGTPPTWGFFRLANMPIPRSQHPHTASCKFCDLPLFRAELTSINNVSEPSMFSQFSGPS